MSGKFQVSLKFGGVSIDHLVVSKPLGTEAQLVAKTVEDKINLTHSSTVESATKCGKELYNDGIRVTFHSVERLDHGELSLPLIELFDNSGEVSNQE